jgi:4-hydroxyphenylacetate 3-monooxygenase
LCGGQICLTPSAASFAAAGPGQWLEKFYTLNDNWHAEDRRKLLAFARDLLNSDHAGHRLTFVQFAQSPHFNHLNAVYNAFDFSGPLEFVKKAADLSDRVDISDPEQLLRGSRSRRGNRTRPSRQKAPVARSSH